MRASIQAWVGVTVPLLAWLATACDRHVLSGGDLGRAGPPGQLVTMPKLGTNLAGLVSIGITHDARDCEPLMNFFASNGIACAPEGTVVWDLMVRPTQVEDVRRLLRTSRPHNTRFIPAEDIDSPNQPVQRTGASRSALATNRTTSAAGSRR